MSPAPVLSRNHQDAELRRRLFSFAQPARLQTLIAQQDGQQGRMHLKMAIIFDEAELTKFVHEVIDA